MPLYRFYFLNPDDEVRDIRAIEFRNDSMATKHIQDSLAGQTHYVAVELWRASGFIGRIGHDGMINHSLVQNFSTEKQDSHRHRG